MIRRPPRSTLFPPRPSSDLELQALEDVRSPDAAILRDLFQYSDERRSFSADGSGMWPGPPHSDQLTYPEPATACNGVNPAVVRSEEHTSELQSPCNLVCRLL